MTIEKFYKLLKSEPSAREKIFSKLLLDSNERQVQMNINLDYYDGNHWELNHENDTTNTTRSGKLIWGKFTANQIPESGRGSKMPIRAASKGNNIAFHEGQLQTRNFIKTFTNIYQEFVTGSKDEEITISAVRDETTINENGEEIQNENESLKGINEVLKDLWENARTFVKMQIAKGIINTVMTAEIKKDPLSDSYKVEVVDSKEIFPIYNGDKKVGTIRAYYIEAEEATELSGEETDKKTALFVEAYYPVLLADRQIQYYYARFIDGKLVEEPMALIEEKNYDVYTISNNIGHPYRKFDDYTLADSEIFNWIDKNDALNSYETIAFITNQYLAMPKVSIDMEVASKLGIDVQSPEFKQNLSNFQYFGGQLDTLPIKLVQGQTVPESFYNNLDRLEDGMYVDASIPKFLIDSESMNNIAADTVRLGLSMLHRKITQKRENIERLIIELSEKCLKAKGLITETLEKEGIEIEIEWPEIGGMTQKELVDHLVLGLEKGIYPKRYAQAEVLKLIGREEDLEKVKSEDEQELSSLANEIQSKRRVVQSERLAEQQLRDKDNQRRELATIEAQKAALEE